MPVKTEVFYLMGENDFNETLRRVAEKLLTENPDISIIIQELNIKQGVPRNDYGQTVTVTYFENTKPLALSRIVFGE